MAFGLPHKEARKGEAWIMNIVSSNISDRYIKWKTLRLGKTAYDINDNPIDGCVPVFVQRSELIEAGIDPDQHFPYLPIKLEQS